MSQRAAKIMALTAAINNDTPDGNQGIRNIVNSQAHSILDEPSSNSLSVDESIDQLKIFVDDIPVIFEDINLTANSSVEYVMVHQESARKPDDRENEKGKNDVEKYTIGEEEELETYYMNGEENDETRNLQSVDKEDEGDSETHRDSVPDERETSGADTDSIENENLVKDRSTKRKKKRDPSTWKRQMNKKLRMEGKEYLSTTKDEHKNELKKAARKLGPVCACNSLARSCNKIREEVRQEIFDSFWQLNWENKKSYVRSLVNYEEKKRCYVQTDSRRKGTLYYHLQVGNEKLKVCKKMFLGTLGMKERSVRDWVTNATIHGMPKCKALKKQRTNKQQKNTERRNLMIEFINAIPKLPSHYSKSIRPGRKAGDPTVNHLKCLQYAPDGIIYYKTDYLQKSYTPLPQRPTTSAAPFTERPLYKHRIPITKQKYDHLQELTQVLPAEVKKFYDDIPFQA